MLLFMLLPALHLVNLNIGRIEERTSEIGVRKSFGASTRTLVGQFVAENVLLTLVGAALSLPLSWGILAVVSLGGLTYMDAGVLLRTFFFGVIARPVLRHRLRGLAGLEDGAPASGQGVDREEGGMIPHLCRLAWNRRRTNLLLVAELFLSFLVLTPLVAGWVLFAAEELKPLGFEYEDVWSVQVVEPGSSMIETRKRKILGANVELDVAGNPRARPGGRSGPGQ